MYYLIIHLRREEFEEDLLLAMASAGVMDAIVVDGVSARQTMARALPIFAGFRADLAGTGTYAKMISAVVEDEGAVDAILSELRHADIDFIRENVGSMILLPITKMVQSEEL